MSIDPSSPFRISPKEIYLTDDEYCEVVDFCTDDSQESLQKCINFFQNKKSVCEFKNGNPTRENIIFLAAQKINVSVLSWIVQQCDPKILSMYDHVERLLWPMFSIISIVSEMLISIPI